MKLFACLLLTALLHCSLACVDKDPDFCPHVAKAGHCVPNNSMLDAATGLHQPTLDYCAKSCNNCGGATSGPGLVTAGPWEPVTAGPGPVTSGPIAGQLSHPSCGKRPLAGSRDASQARVINGVESVPGDWGWSVSITRNGGQHFCGGILINDQYILSAAHCFANTGTNTAGLAVDIGVHHRQMKERWVQNRKIARVTSHAGYHNQKFTNDITIIKLASPVTIDNQYVIPACIPGENGQFDYQGKKGTVTGWGDQKYMSMQGSITKREGTQDILTDAACTQKYAQFQFNPVGQICAGETWQYSGACQGDSGGPFVVQHTDGRWYAYGVVSFGLDCGYGTVYTRVSNYLPWIKQNMY